MVEGKRISSESRFIGCRVTVMLMLYLVAVATAAAAGEDIRNLQTELHFSSNDDALKLLDILLRKYDRRSTPTNNLGMATNVSLELYVASLGSINTENMDYVTDTYLRQQWWDPRLAHENWTSPMDLADPKLVQAIWKPEVFFPNAKDANFQFVTVPNVLIRIHPNGDILYILRLRLKFSCMMELSRYPLDRQICGMQIASFSKTTRELQLFWSETHTPVTIAADLKMPQFTIERVTPTICNEQFHLGNYSCLVAEFHMKRSVSFHLIQSYLPSILIVAVSWVSFWMDIESVPGRISLGVITLLAVSSQAGLDKNIPQTSYVKAIDVWMGLCTAFVFAALVEFTVVNFWFRKRRSLQRVKNGGGGAKQVDAESGHHVCCCCSNSNSKEDMNQGNNSSNDQQQQHQTSTSSSSSANHNLGSPTAVVLGQNGKTTTTTIFDRQQQQPQQQPYEHEQQQQQPTFIHPAERVDQASRILFPLGFLVCNGLYWLYYLYMPDSHFERQ